MSTIDEVTRSRFIAAPACDLHRGAPGELVVRRGTMSVGLAVLSLVMTSGCPVCYEANHYGFIVRGVLQDSMTQSPLPDTYLVVSLRSDGEQFAFAAFAIGSDVGALLTDASGAFLAEAIEGRWGDCPTIGVLPAAWLRIPTPTRPDEIRLTVHREGCVQVIVVPINSDTVTDFAFPADTTVLAQPVLVPACPDAITASP